MPARSFKVLGIGLRFRADTGFQPKLISQRFHYYIDPYISLWINEVSTNQSICQFLTEINEDVRVRSFGSDALKRTAIALQEGVAMVRLDGQDLRAVGLSLGQVVQLDRAASWLRVSALGAEALETGTSGPAATAVVRDAAVTAPGRVREAGRSIGHHLLAQQTAEEVLCVHPAQHLKQHTQARLHLDGTNTVVVSVSTDQPDMM